jgi:ribosomal protein S18 acetylase RimI-like enzyme
MNLLPNVLNGLRLALDTDPPAGFRAELGQLINRFHGEIVPFQASRFTLRLEDQGGRLVGGLSGVMSWGWLFIDALWVHSDRRGQGIGRVLMAHAESHAVAAGCHSAWLDTFRACGFYEAIGYSVFGTLEDYPADQTRSFLRKCLSDRSSDPDQAALRA